MTDRESAISELQQYLRNISRNEADEPTIIPDGIFSGETKKAVEDFQRREGIEVTGVVNFETWEALRRANAVAVYENALPIQVAPISNSDLPLRKGDSGRLVEALKLMLDSIADRYSNFNFTGGGDLFDERTEREVLRFQEIALLEGSGEADRETWDRLALLYLLRT